MIGARRALTGRQSTSLKLSEENLNAVKMAACVVTSKGTCSNGLKRQDGILFREWRV